MTPYLTLEQGLRADGLRIAPMLDGVPSPWSEWCRALFRVKGIPSMVIQARDPDQGLARLQAVTGQASLPVVFWASERPRAGWLEQLHLAERLAAEPGLLPDAARERAQVIGLLAELCAEDGFGWHRRILLIEHLLADAGRSERERSIGRYLAAKYGYTKDGVRESRRRCEEVVAAFVEQFETPGRFLSGDGLTALDLGWAAFAALIRPLPHELCPMDALWRELYTWTPRGSSPEAVDALLAHRDRIYRDWLALPVAVR